MNLHPKEVAAIKLLNEGIEYQSYFFKKVTDLKWFFPLKENGFFSFKHNPKPVESQKDKGYYTIPHWSALDYLEKISRECDKPENDKYAKALLKIIHEVTNPKPPDKRIDNYRTWWSFLKIMANLPLELIKDYDIALIQYWLEGNFGDSLLSSEITKNLFPKFLNIESEKNESKIIKLLEIITLTKSQKSSLSRQEESTYVDSHWLIEFFKKYSKKIGEICPEKAIELLEKRIKEIINPKDEADKYSSMWRSSIEDNEQNIEEESARAIFIIALREILTGFVETNSSDAEKIINKFLSSDYFILQRIAIYILGKFFDKFESNFWNHFNDNYSGLLHKLVYRHELYKLFENNFSKFSEDKKEYLVNLIKDFRKDKDEPDNIKKSMRMNWLSAFIHKEYKQADNLYKEYKNELNYEPEHPEFTSYFSSSFVGEEIVISPEKILSFESVDKLVDYISKLQIQGEAYESADTKIGNSLKTAIKSNPEKFENNLDDFLKCDRPETLAKIVSAFDDLWRDKISFNWEKVLSFCQQLADRYKDSKSNSEDEVEIWKSPQSKINEAISYLIRIGSGKDEFVFDNALLPKALEIVDLMLTHQEFSIEPSKKPNYEVNAINLPYGKVFESLFSVVLRQCRIFDKKHSKEESKKNRDEYWQKSLEKIFDRELKKANENNNLEFFKIIGYYLPNIYYLNSEWATTNFSSLYPVENTPCWSNAIMGYAYVNTIYSPLYNLLKTNGSIEKVLATDWKDKSDNYRSKIIENIGVMYLRGQELFEKEESMISKVLKDFQEEDIYALIGLFWRHREAELPDGAKTKILEFWKHCYNHINGNEEKYKSLLSKLNLLIAFIDEITTENKKWIMQSISYAERRYHTYQVIEYLYKLSDKNIKNIGEICVKMIEHEVPPDRHKEMLIITHKLYQANQHDLANQICDKFGRKQIESFRKVYEKYNNHEKKN